ncbi:MAG: CRTAC1 family protein [Planctomycetes bacterium]|nr:CRTAC1 family protein [Planctomycetota bacterium]
MSRSRRPSSRAGRALSVPSIAGLVFCACLPGCGDSASGPAGSRTTAAADGPFVDAGLLLAPLTCGGENARTILEVNGGGLALFDADGDGDLEILLVDPGPYPSAGVASGGTNTLYRNDGGMHFVDVGEASGVGVPGFCNGVAVGDVDADGRRDVYLTRLGPNALLRNTGDLRFEELPEAGGAAGDGWSTSAVFVDVDLDGDLDLYVVDYLAFDADHPPLHGVDGRDCRWKGMPVMCGPQGLPAQPDHYYRNDDGRLVDATAAAGFDAPPGYGLGCLDGDFDADGWPDVYVSNDSTPNFLFLNTGHGKVVESGLAAGAALSSRGREQAGMGIAAGDLEGDGDEDLLVTNFSMESNALYVNDGGRFDDRADPMGVGGPSRRLLGWGAAFVDFDLDGALDLVNANGHVYPQADEPGTDTSYAQPDTLWHNDGGGRFSPRAWDGDAPAVSRALSSGDLDDDGVTDLVILRRSGRPMVWRGLAPERRSLTVALDGGPGNPDGCGAVVAFTDAEGTRTRRVRSSAGYQAAGDPRALFAWRGTGTLDVRWPDGTHEQHAVDAPGTLALGAAR